MLHSISLPEPPTEMEDWSDNKLNSNFLCVDKNFNENMLHHFQMLFVLNFLIRNTFSFISSF